MAEITTKVVWFPTGWPSLFKPNDPSKPHSKSLPHTSSLKKCWPTMVLLHLESLLIAVNVELPGPLSWFSASSQATYAESFPDAFVLLYMYQHSSAASAVFSFRYVITASMTLTEFLWVFWLFERQNVSLKCLHSFICVRKQNLSGGLQAQIGKMQQPNFLVCYIGGLALEIFFFTSVLWLETGVWFHALRMLLKFKNSCVNDNF